MGGVCEKVHEFLSVLIVSCVFPFRDGDDGGRSCLRVTGKRRKRHVEIFWDRLLRECQHDEENMLKAGYDLKEQHVKSP